MIAIPNVIGQTEAEARKTIQDAGLNNTYTNFQTANDVADKQTFLRQAPGRVVSQQPSPGVSVVRGTTVYIAVRRA
jgi:beta-lactam-binding protein with PASTA domain